MWIVKNELSEALPLPELRIEIGCKEYVDLDAHGRGKAEESSSVRHAIAKGTLRVISKTAPEAEPPRPAAAEPAGVLRDLVENPPVASGKALLIPPHMAPPGTEDQEPTVSVKEAFRRLTRGHRRSQEPEEPASSPEMAEIRKELESFRRKLLADFERMLEEKLGPP